MESSSDFGDRVVGFLLFLASVILFSYYTCWVLVTPFLESDHHFQAYFLALEYAVSIPVCTGIVLLSFVVIFIGVVMIRADKNEVMISDSNKVLLMQNWIAGQ